MERARCGARGGALSASVRLGEGPRPAPALGEGAHSARAWTPPVSRAPELSPGSPGHATPHTTVKRPPHTLNLHTQTHTCTHMHAHTHAHTHTHNTHTRRTSCGGPPLILHPIPPTHTLSCPSHLLSPRTPLAIKRPKQLDRLLVFNRHPKEVKRTLGLAI